MASVTLVRGGLPQIKYMWCENDWPQNVMCFKGTHIDGSGLYDSHIDGAYALGHFTQSFPLRMDKTGSTWIGKALREANLKPDDIIRVLAVPEACYATMLNFAIDVPDPALAGASIALTAEEVKYDSLTKELVFKEITDVEDAVAAQGITTPIPLDKPISLTVSLMKVEGGYAKPLFAQPTMPPADVASDPTWGRTIVFGYKIVSLPADNKVTLDMAKNGWYLIAHTAEFTSMTHY